MTNRNHIHVLSRAVIIDQEHILTCRTLDLPKQFYFLPGGHIEHGESAATAVLREVLEESGVQASIKRFLGILEHSFTPGHNSICHSHEYNLFFEVESADLKVHSIVPSLETHLELLWMPLESVSDLDLRPEPLKYILQKWIRYETSNIFESKMI